ncbi:MAG: YqaA family protein [Burkholderiaceae bacterium]
MPTFWEQSLAAVLLWLALPRHGLGAVFVIAFISATLLPLGSEPAVYGLVQLQPALFWPALAVATAGNTLGGALNWWIGFGLHKALDRKRPARFESRFERHALGWLERFGPKACAMSWLPLVGDPLCAVAGWLKLPFWPCVAWMALGKFLRYLVLTAGLLWVF